MVSSSLQTLPLYKFFLLRGKKIMKMVSKNHTVYSVHKFLKWSDAFNPSKYTHTAINTHTPWTHTRSSGQPILRRPGSSWEFGALLKGTSVVVLKVERECWLFTPPTYNPCRTGDSNPWPSAYKSDSSSIRPRLPKFGVSKTENKSLLLTKTVIYDHKYCKKDAYNRIHTEYTQPAHFY